VSIPLSASRGGTRWKTSNSSRDDDDNDDNDDNNNNNIMIIIIAAHQAEPFSKKPVGINRSDMPHFYGSKVYYRIHRNSPQFVSF
jgi:hypothetical protein